MYKACWKELTIMTHDVISNVMYVMLHTLVGYVKLQTFVPHWNNFPGPDFSEVFLRDDICTVKCTS